MTISTTRGDMEASALVKSEVRLETEGERTTVVEYCLAGCDGPWHLTHRPDREGVFCAQHVHRSVDMYLKHGLDLAGVAGGIG